MESETPRPSRFPGNANEIIGYCGRDGVLTETNGLIYMRARYYSVELMRFVNEDIVLGDISNSNSLNRYTYVEGNPATMIDPFGLEAERANISTESVLEIIHTSLDILGMIPALGVGPDAINTILYLLEGDWKNAAFSGLAIIPALGETAMAGKMIGKLRKAVSGIKKTDSINDVLKWASKYGDEVAEAVTKYGDEAAEAVTKYSNDVGEFITKNGDDVLKGGKASDIPWSSNQVANAAKDLQNGAKSVEVANRSQAEELFLRLFQGDGYKNVSGLDAMDAKNLLGGKGNTYHWDDLFGSDGLLLGHGANNPDSMMKHLQIHPEGGKVIRIFFE